MSLQHFTDKFNKFNEENKCHIRKYKNNFKNYYL